MELLSFIVFCLIHGLLLFLLAKGFQLNKKITGEYSRLISATVLILIFIVCICIPYYFQGYSYYYYKDDLDLRNVHLGLVNNPIIQIFAYIYSHKLMGLSLLLPSLLFIIAGKYASSRKLDFAIKIFPVAVVCWLSSELHKYDSTIALALE